MLAKVTPENFAASRPRPATSQARRIELEPHIATFLERLQTHWPEAAWDESTDIVAYGRQLVGLTREQVRELYYRCRERHTFRPSVAEVRAIAQELLAQANPTHALSGHDAAVRHVVSLPRALPSAANGPGRQRARQMMAARRLSAQLPVRGEAGESAETPATLVGKIVTFFERGQERRGVVWKHEGDLLAVRVEGNLVSVDSGVVRVEEAR